MKLQSQNRNEGVMRKDKGKKSMLLLAPNVFCIHAWVMLLRDGHFNISSDYRLNNKGYKRK